MKETGSRKNFWELSAEIFREQFLKATGGEESYANEAMLEFSKLHVGENEHGNLEQMQKDEPHRFNQLVAKMAFEESGSLLGFLEFTRETYSKFKGFQEPQN